MRRILSLDIRHYFKTLIRHLTWSLDSVMGKMIKVLCRYKILYLFLASTVIPWLCRRVGFLLMVLSWTETHVCVLVSRYCNTLDGRQQARSGTLWSLSRPLIGCDTSLTPAIHTNLFGRFWRHSWFWSGQILLNHTWITAENRMCSRCFRSSRWRRATLHISALDSSGPKCVDCALNTAVIDGRVRCCLPRFTSWFFLWLFIDTHFSVQ